jgi:hypothetical protein
MASRTSLVLLSKFFTHMPVPERLRTRSSVYLYL